MTETKLMLIDGNSLLFRAFYALPLLHNREGVYTNGVYGFLTMFNRVVAEEQPTHIVVAFDKSRETFRNEIYADYKATRSEPPAELVGQFELLRETLKALNVPYIEMQGYEADDIIGTISAKAAQQGHSCVILTGDTDTLQLVSDSVTVLMTRRGITDIERYDVQKVMEKWEVEPEQLVEIKGLMGDNSDNIPGVPGIGPKTAIKLIKQYHSLENLYEHLDELRAKQADLLARYQEQAFTSRELGTIVRDMDLTYDLDDYQRRPPDLKSLTELYQRLEFNSLLKNLQQSLASGPGFQPEHPKVDVKMIESQAEYDEALKLLGNEIGLFITASYHHPMWAKIEEVYLASESQVFGMVINEDQQYKLEWLKPMLESNQVKKFIHNAKFAEVLLARCGIKLRGVTLDSLLLAYVLDPVFDGEKFPDVLYKYLNITVPADQPGQQAGQLHILCRSLQNDLPPESRSLYYDVELPLSTVLARMELNGVKIDGDVLQAIAAELEQRIESAEEVIFQQAGGAFNINSPRQLARVLFEDLALPPVKKTKSGYSTDAEVLEQLLDQHEIVGHILNYRQLTKLKTTYVDALRSMIHPQTGRVHTIFKQAQTATGRLSSVEPNLQNIPIRMEEGRRIRAAFIAKDEDHVILSADYSQIDLRSLAHISRDETLIETFRQGIDIHTRTAAEIFSVSLDQVTAEMRRKAKAINFGIIYGMGDFRLAHDTGVSRKEARVYIDNYLNTYPGVKRYMEDIVQFGREHGYVETVLKRRRYLPDLRAKNRIVQNNARRIALNTPIQGTSADIIKLAMIKIYRELERLKLESCLLLQVHDELLLEVPRSHCEQVAHLLKTHMENAYELVVPLVVTVKQGSNWYDMKEIKVD
ncbi:MAG: DNA polymerase I [Syntrophomonadaceae bacterium]